MLRAKGVFNIDEVAFAILESTVELSILKKQQFQPQEKGIALENESLPVLLIVDGKLQEENLFRCNIDSKIIISRIREMGFNSVDEIFVATYENGKLSISPKKTRIKEQKLKY